MTVLLLFVILSYWDAHTLKQDLSKYATSQILEYLQLDTRERLVGVKITVTRRWLFFGQPLGKTDLYVAVDDPKQPVKYVGYTFYYEKQNNQWTVVESGACTGMECQWAAQKLDRVTH